MKTIKFIGAAIALALVPATAFAAAGCCADKTCCKDGADCCKDMKGGDNAGQDMSGMKMPSK